MHSPGTLAINTWIGACLTRRAGARPPGGGA